MLEVFPIGAFCLLKIIKPEDTPIIFTGADKDDNRNELEVLRVGSKVVDIKVGDRLLLGPGLLSARFRGGDYYLIEERMIAGVVRENPKAKKAVIGVTVAIPYAEENEDDEE